MNWFISFYIGLRYWHSKKSERFTSFIIFFSVTGIVLGVSSLIHVSSVMNSLEGQQKEKILGAVPHILLTPRTTIEMKDWPAWRGETLTLDGVQQAEPTFQHQVVLQSASNIQGVMLQGIDPTITRDPFIESNLIMGRMKNLTEHPFGLILGTQVAQDLNISIGDTVRVISSQGVVYSPIGLLPSQRKFRVIGLFSSGSSSDSYFALANYKNATQLARLPSKNIQQIRLYLHDAFDIEHVRNEVAENFPDAFEMQDWQRTFGHKFAAVKMEKTMMAMMLSLIVIVAVFNIISALVMMVTDKTTDVAILKTQGMQKKNLMLIFMIQGMLSGVIGLILGVSLGLGLTLNFETILREMNLYLLPAGQSLPIIIDIPQIILLILGTLVTTFLATLYPAWRAANIYPAEALRYE